MDLKNFNEEELQLIKNQQFFQTKKNVLEKVEWFFSQLPSKIDATFSSLDLAAYNPKISKGENYHDFPYRVLDFPNNFSKNNYLALRVIFIFGHGFSFHFIKTIDNKGEIIQNISNIFSKDIFINIQENLWVHHYDNEIYIKLIDLSSNDLENIINTQNNLKLSFFSNALDFSSIEAELFEFIRKMNELL